MSAAFDTLKLSRRLEATGFSREQATGMAEVLNDALGGELVTRDYLDSRLNVLEERTDARQERTDARLAELKAEIAEVKADIARVETKVEAEIRDLDRRMTIKLGGMMMLAVGAVAALVKLL